jgi:hypothetical protein
VLPRHPLVSRAIGDHRHEAHTLKRLGDLALRQGDLGTTKQAHAEALAVYRATGSRLGESHALRGLGLAGLVEGRGVTEELRASSDIASAIHDVRGELLSRALLALADPSPTAATTLDALADRFSSVALPWESLLVRAAARLEAGDVPAAASMLRERPETAPLAQALAHATPEEGIRLLLPVIPTS